MLQSIRIRPKQYGIVNRFFLSTLVTVHFTYSKRILLNPQSRDELELLRGRLWEAEL